MNHESYDDAGFRYHPHALPRGKIICRIDLRWKDTNGTRIDKQIEIVFVNEGRGGLLRVA